MLGDVTTTSGSPLRPGSPELSALLAKIAQGAVERDRSRILPFEQMKWVREAGLGRLTIPAAEGGGGASISETFQVVIDLASADPNVAHILRSHYDFVNQQLHSVSEAERSKWFGLINEGSLIGGAWTETTETLGKRGALQFQTTIAPIAESDEYVLNGTKQYSTGNQYVDWIVVAAARPDGSSAVATIPTSREGVHLVDDWDGFGQKLTASGTTRLEDVRVRQDEVVDFGAAGETDDPTYVFAFSQLYLQAVTAGILRAVRDDAAHLVRGRRRGYTHAGARLPREDRQVLQVVGEIAADAFAAEAIVLSAAQRLQDAADSVREGIADPELAVEAQIAAANAKVAVDRYAAATATALFDAGGASSTRDSLDLDRHWRNIRTISTHNPTSLKASAIGDFHVNDKRPPSSTYF